MSRGGAGFLSPQLLLPHTHLDHLQVLCSSRHSCLYFPNGPPSVCQSLLPALQAFWISESPLSTSLTTCFSKNLLLATFSVLAALKRFSFLHCHSAWMVSWEFHAENYLLSPLWRYCFISLAFFFLVGGGVGVLSIKRHVVNLSFIRPFRKKDLITFKIHLLGSEDSTKPLGV